MCCTKKGEEINDCIDWRVREGAIESVKGDARETERERERERGREGGREGGRKRPINHINAPTDPPPSSRTSRVCKDPELECESTSLPYFDLIDPIENTMGSSCGDLNGDGFPYVSCRRSL